MSDLVQLGNDMLLKEVITEPLMRPASYVNQNLLSNQGLHKVMQLYV